MRRRFNVEAVDDVRNEEPRCLTPIGTPVPVPAEPRAAHAR